MFVAGDGGARAGETAEDRSAALVHANSFGLSYQLSTQAVMSVASSLTLR